MGVLEIEHLRPDPARHVLPRRNTRIKPYRRSAPWSSTRLTGVAEADLSPIDTLTSIPGVDAGIAKDLDGPSKQ
jgi:hypothetical protein